MDPRDAHPSIETLIRANRGEIPLAVVEEEEREHLHALCPACAAFWEEFEEMRRRRAAERDSAAASEEIAPQSREMETLLAGDRRIAEREVEEVLDMEPEDREAKVTNAYKRFRTPAFVERMIEEARTWVWHDCGEALALLALAEARLPKIRREIYGEGLVHRVTLRLLAHQGNALRVAGELRAAEEKFAAVAEKLCYEPVEDCALLGELASLEASLRRSQRRFDDAEALLERAAALFRREGDGAGLAKVLVKRGALLYTNEEPVRAIGYLEAASSAATAAADARVTLSARHNLLLCLCAAGQPAAARELLEEARPLYEEAGDPTSLDLLVWAEGKVAAGLGEDETALGRLRAARDGYAERGMEYDAAMVCLDLAEIRFRRGETAQVRRLAERMARAFSARGVDREATRAVALFRKAALAEAVTAELIARTRTTLLRAAGRSPRRSS